MPGASLRMDSAEAAKQRGVENPWPDFWPAVLAPLVRGGSIAMERNEADSALVLGVSKGRAYALVFAPSQRGVRRP
ncbi:MAG: hypothetical protein NVSMB1_15170 [Polyangiales bacterium]